MVWDRVGERLGVAVGGDPLAVAVGCGVAVSEGGLRVRDAVRVGLRLWVRSADAEAEAVAVRAALRVGRAVADVAYGVGDAVALALARECVRLNSPLRESVWVRDRQSVGERTRVRLLDWVGDGEREAGDGVGVRARVAVRDVVCVGVAERGLGLAVVGVMEWHSLAVGVGDGADAEAVRGPEAVRVGGGVGLEVGGEWLSVREGEGVRVGLRVGVAPAERVGVWDRDGELADTVTAVRVSVTEGKRETECVREGGVAVGRGVGVPVIAPEALPVV